MVVWIVIESEVFVSAVLRVGERDELMMSCVMRAVVWVLRVSRTVWRM